MSERTRPPIPEVASKEENEATIARLERWLLRPGWSLDEAVRVLAGLLSDSSNPEIPFFLHAPRGWSGRGGRELAQALDCREAYLRHRWADLDLSPQPPDVWLKRAIEIGEPPGWLTVARRIERLRRLLPEELQADGKATAKQTTADMSNAEKGGRARNKGTFADLARSRVREEWQARGMADRGPEEVGEFLKTMIEELVDPEAPRGQDKPKTANEARNPKVRTETPIRDEVRRLSAG